MLFQIRGGLVLGLVCTCFRFVDQGKLPSNYEQLNLETVTGGQGRSYK